MYGSQILARRMWERTIFYAWWLLYVWEVMCLAAAETDVTKLIGVIETIIACVSVAHGFGKAPHLLPSAEQVTSMEKV